MTLPTGQGDLCLEIDGPSAPAARDLDFLFRDASTSARLGQDPSKPAILEVVQLWQGTVLAMDHLAPGGAALTLGGAGDRFTAPADDLPAGSMPLFSATPGGFVLRFSDRWEGFVQDPDGGRSSLAELCASGRAHAVSAGIFEVSVPASHTAWIDTGHVLFAARHVPPGRRPAAAWSDRIDYPFLGVLSLSGFLSVLLGVAIASAPPPVETEVPEVPDRIAQVFIQAPAPTPAPTVAPEATNRDSGAKAKGKEGTVGERRSKRKIARGERSLRQKLDREVADNAGLMGALNDDSGALASVFGSSALSADLAGSVGGLIGAKGAQMGTNGLGSRGDALGGGGPAEGLGGVGTHGRRDGDGRYGTPGGGRPKQEGRVENRGEVITLGALDRSLVDAVVKRHMSAIRYCYQRELTRAPDLGGKVSVRFVIAGDGSVSRAAIKASSLGSAAVESCITDRFMRMKFPAPKGHGIVMVTYPFFFSAG